MSVNAQLRGLNLLSGDEVLGRLLSVGAVDVLQQVAVDVVLRGGGAGGEHHAGFWGGALEEVTHLGVGAGAVLGGAAVVGVEDAALELPALALARDGPEDGPPQGAVVADDATVGGVVVIEQAALGRHAPGKVVVQREGARQQRARAAQARGAGHGGAHALSVVAVALGEHLGGIVLDLIVLLGDDAVGRVIGIQPVHGAGVAHGDFELVAVGVVVGEYRQPGLALPIVVVAIGLQLAPQRIKARGDVAVDDAVLLEALRVASYSRTETGSMKAQPTHPARWIDSATCS
jgi:hypothetical protein